MENRFEREIEVVLQKLLEMGELASESVQKALDSLFNEDKEAAQRVVMDDKNVDLLMKDIESRCFRILLLDQPVAGDFRKVGSALKMITDLERIGDYSVDIAEEVIAFPKEERDYSYFVLPRMGECVSSMVKKAVHSFLMTDIEEARSLEKDDDRVDAYFAEMKEKLIEEIKKDERGAESAIISMMIVKYLERIGDHAVNVGEWVDYSLTGTHLVS